MLSFLWGAPAEGKRLMKYCMNCSLLTLDESMSLFRKQFHINGNLWLIDGYATVYTKRRPDPGKPSAPKSMCTIFLKVFKNIQAVTSFDPLTFHNPEGIDVTLLVNSVSGPQLCINLLAATHLLYHPG